MTRATQPVDNPVDEAGQPRHVSADRPLEETVVEQEWLALPWAKRGRQSAIARCRVMRVIDLRLLREDPELVRASQRLRGESPSVVDDLLRADEARRAAMQRFEALRAEQKQLGKQVAQGHRRRAGRAAGPHQGAGRPGQGGRGGRRPRPSRRCAGPTWRCPTSSRTACRPAARTTSSCCARSASRPAIDNPRDHLELGEALGAIDIERGAKVSGSPVLLPHRRGRAAAARPAAAGDRSRRSSTASPR